MHCWHQAVRVRPARPGDSHGDIAVDTAKARAVYQQWMTRTRPAGQRLARRHPAAPLADAAAQAARRRVRAAGRAFHRRRAFVSAERRELLRALGAFADSPADARTAAAALGLAPPSAAEHTDAFVLNCPPYASVYLGPDGALGGEGADRAAGFWRAIGITPPAEPDHLTALLSLYASLGDAARRRPPPGHRPRRWPGPRPRCSPSTCGRGCPAYLDAVGDLAIPALDGWAALTRRAIAAERAARPAPARAAAGPAVCAGAGRAGRPRSAT